MIGGGTRASEVWKGGGDRMISVRLDLHRCRKGRELGRGDLVDGCGQCV